MTETQQSVHEEVFDQYNLPKYSDIGFDVIPAVGV